MEYEAFVTKHKVAMKIYKTQQDSDSPSIIVMPNRRDFFVIFLAQLNLFEVGYYPVFAYAARNNRVSSVHSPCEEYLCRRSTELMCNGLYDWIVCELRYARH